MKFFLIIFFLVILFFRNLSAYQEISIQKNDLLNNYSDLVNLINTSVSNQDIKSLLEKHLYNVNFSLNFIRFEFDTLSLTQDLDNKNFHSNLLFLNCSLNKSFFDYNNVNLECPSFKLKSFNNKKYIYLKFKNKLFRIKEFNQNDDLRNIWINLFQTNSSSYVLSIDTDNYNNLFLLTDYSPKILDYNNKKINLDIKSVYSPNQFNFLLNFFK
jgi:hypothetical protein